jgi:hypothetical protein
MPGHSRPSSIRPRPGLVWRSARAGIGRPSRSTDRSIWWSRRAPPSRGRTAGRAGTVVYRWTGCRTSSSAVGTRSLRLGCDRPEAVPLSARRPPSCESVVPRGRSVPAGLGFDQVGRLLARGRSAGSVAWAVVDQSVSSATNVAVGVLWFAASRRRTSAPSALCSSCTS